MISGKKKILAIDDDKFMLEFLTDLFAREGYQLMTARDGLSALNILEDETPDIIFIDLVMSGIGGKKLCRIIRGMDRFKDVYIAILSATLADEKIDMVELGVNALIAKGPLSEMGQHILDVIKDPGLASSRCLSGAVIGMEDIYPRGVTKELLRLNRSFEAILQGMKDGILEAAPDGRVIFINQVALSIIGKVEEKVLGCFLTDLFGADNRERMRGLMHALKRAEMEPVKAVNLTAWKRRLEISIMPVGGSGGNVIVVVSDVTEACEAVEALETSHAQMKEMIAKNMDAMVIVKRDGRVIFANPAAEVLLRKGPDSLVGSDFGFVLAPEESTELDLIGPNKEPLVAEMRVAELWWRGKRVYLASLRDITKRKQMEESIRNANRIILEQQKSRIEEERLKVLLQMAGATVHELNQPLATLLGDIELLEMEAGAAPETVSRRLGSIVDSGKRIAAVVSRIRPMRGYETKPFAGGDSIVDLHQKSRFLVVEDSDKEYAIIDAVFKAEENISLLRARTIAEAFQILEKNEIDLILMDYSVPDGNAFKLMEAMNGKGLEIPVVVITGHGDEMTATRIIQAGAADYLTKESLTTESLFISVKNALEKSGLKRELHTVREKMTEMATRDDLTGLYNRRYGTSFLEKEVERARRYHTPLTFCMIDLDHFKGVNDRYGHQAGDAVLTAVANLFNENVRHTDAVCRYGGEEFALILTNTEEKGAMVFCERLREEAARQVVKWKGTSIGVTISIGVAQYYDEKDSSPAGLVERADKALYRAKEEGRNRVVRQVMNPQKMRKYGVAH